MIEEDRRDKLPANHATKQVRLEWEKKEHENRKVFTATINYKYNIKTIILIHL